MEDSELNMMEEKPMAKVADHESAFFRKSVWPTVKPFVNGGLAPVLQGSCAYFTTCLFYRLNPTPKSSPHFMHRKMLYVNQQMPFLLFQGGINMASLFGSYELLTRKVEALNKGSPLTLYQEVGCGLASGAIRACIWHPLIRPLGAGIAHAATDKYYYFRHIFSTITQLVRSEGVLALWKGAWRRSPPIIASNTGMLVSYDRCRIYLKEAYHLREDDARLGAGIFSGLCAGACYFPVSYATGMIGYIRSTRVEIPCSFLFYAVKVLKPGGGTYFYSRLVKHALFNSPSVMVMWVFLEAIRDAEESIGL